MEYVLILMLATGQIIAQPANLSRCGEYIANLRDGAVPHYVNSTGDEIMIVAAVCGPADKKAKKVARK